MSIAPVSAGQISDRAFWRAPTASLLTALGASPDRLDPARRRSLNPNDKTNLAPYRFLHLAIVIILGARFIPIDAPGLHATI